MIISIETNGAHRTILPNSSSLRTSVGIIGNINLCRSSKTWASSIGHNTATTKKATMGKILSGGIEWGLLRLTFRQKKCERQKA